MIKDGYIICLQEVGLDLLHHLQALDSLAKCHIDMENSDGTNFNVTIYNPDTYKFGHMCVAVPRPIQDGSEYDVRNPPKKTYASRFFLGDLSFVVVNLHVEFKRLSLYMRCIEDMVSDYPEMPIFVGGDFNAGCRDDHGDFEIRMDHIKNVPFAPTARFFVPTLDWYTHCNVFRNVGRSSRQIDKFDYAMVWGDRDMLNSKLCIDFM